MAKARNAGIRRGCFTKAAIFSLTIVGFALFGLMPTAQAAKPTTWIVIDAGNGQILSAHDPDSLNYPASLTKMMTLFLTFDALEHRRITLDQRFPVSRHAAVQAPSKLGLVPGSSLPVRELILAVVTHSANDAAVVLAEGLAGTEATFAMRMNDRARALGMTRTNFRNASGLPDRFQYTTARDLSTLALALYRTFPKEYAYFATENFTYHGETYANHNHLMEAFQGMDGIKTGFINASGFNLAASAVRDNRRLIGVIMGGRTAVSRDMDMAELLDDAFAHRGQRSPDSSTFASNAAPKHDNLPLRNGDNLSALSVVAAASPQQTEPEIEHPAPGYRTVAAHRHRHGRDHLRVARHHPRLRHGVMLAAAEETVPAPSRTLHHRHAVSAKHRQHSVHRYAGRKHQQHLAARHRHAEHRYAASHRHNRAVRSASAARAGHHPHGFACGGWNGHDRPCPSGLSHRSRHDALRSASIERRSAQARAADL
jgi:D-alanyl-D-alanine carboxypeptidase